MRDLLVVRVLEQQVAPGGLVLVVRATVVILVERVAVGERLLLRGDDVVLVDVVRAARVI